MMMTALAAGVTKKHGTMADVAATTSDSRRSGIDEVRSSEPLMKTPQPPLLVYFLPEIGSDKAQTISQDWLCWYPRSSKSNSNSNSSSSSTVWWPALRFPSIQEAQGKFLPNPHRAQQRATKAWTLASFQEAFTKKQYPIVTVILDEHRAEWHPPKDTELAELDFIEHYQHICQSESVLADDQKEAWIGAIKRAYSILSAPSSSADRSEDEYDTLLSPPPQLQLPNTVSAPTTSVLSPRNTQQAQAAAAPKAADCSTSIEPHKATNIAKVPGLNRVSTDTHGRLSLSPTGSALATALDPAAPSSSPIIQRSPNNLFPPSSTNSPNNRDWPVEDNHQTEDDEGSPNTDIDWIPPLETDLKAHAPWNKVWQVLEYSGWTKRLVNEAGGAVRTWFVKPNVQTDQSRAGVGYFTNEYDVQEFCRDMYHWQGPRAQTHEDEEVEDEEEDDESCNDSDAPMDAKNRVEEVLPQRSNDTVVSALTNLTDFNGLSTPPNHRKTRPQDPAKPQLPSHSAESHSICSFATDDNIQDFMNRNGWVTKKGKGTVDWFYIRPGESVKNGVLDLHYFTNLEAVRKYLLDGKAQQGKPKKQGAKSKGKANNKSKNNPTAKAEKRGLRATAEQMPNKKYKPNDTVAPTSKKGKTENTGSKSAGKGAAKPKEALAKGKAENSGSKSAGKGAAKPKEALAKAGKKRKQPISIDRPDRKRELHHLRVSEANEMLKIMGFTLDGGKWKLEVEVNDTLATRSFVSLTGLRKFLCNQGIPNIYLNKAKKKLPARKFRQFIQWVRFANVPLTARKAELALQTYVEPASGTELHLLLTKYNGIETFDGYYYLPDVQSGQHKIGVHRFAKSVVTTDFRKGLRGTSFWHKQSYCWSDMPKKKQDDRLRLLLWAAQCELPLVEFNEETAIDWLNEDKKKDPHETKKHRKISETVEYHKLSEEPYNQQEVCDRDSLDEDVEDDASSVQSSDSKTAESEGGDADPGSVDGTVAESAITTTPDVSSLNSKTTKKKPRVIRWFEERPTWELIWPILEKLGFYHDPKHAGRYQIGNAYVPGGLTEEQVRIGIVWCGVPSYQPQKLLYPSGRKSRDAKDTVVEKVQLEKSQRTLLLKWANFAHFPDHLGPELQESLLRQFDKSIKKDELRTKMEKLGFQFNGEIYYPPGCDEHRRTIDPTSQKVTSQPRVKGLHEVKGNAELAEFMRSAPCLNLLMAEEKQDEVNSILSLRLWAIREAQDIDLPSFPLHPERWNFFQKWVEQARGQVIELE